MKKLLLILAAAVAFAGRFMIGLFAACVVIVICSLLGVDDMTTGFLCGVTVSFSTLITFKKTTP